MEESSCIGTGTPSDLANLDETAFAVSHPPRVTWGLLRITWSLLQITWSLLRILSCLLQIVPGSLQVVVGLLRITLCLLRAWFVKTLSRQSGNNAQVVVSICAVGPTVCLCSNMEH